MFRLVWQRIRRDRIVLPIWILATALLALAGASGVQTEFGTDAERANVLQLAIATPSLLALRGIPDGASLGSYVYFQVFAYLGIMAALMSTFFVTRHARADEERGRLELIESTPVARVTPLLATLTTGVLANAALAVFVALGFTAGGLPGAGAWVAGLAAGSVGLAFVGLAALVSQVTPTSRSANGFSAALVGIAFLVRAIGDATGTPDLDKLTVVSNWPSWLSPIGWGQQAFAFTREDPTPLLLSVALFVVAGAIAVVVHERRDLGSSILRERLGKANGHVTNAFGLAWRQQWPSLVGWSVGAALLAALSGLLGQQIVKAVDIAGPLQDILATFVPGGKGDLLDLLVVAIVSIAGVLAAGAGVQAIQRARSEESDGRVELVLSSPLSRGGWLLGYIAVAVISTAVIVVVTGLFAGLSFLGTDRDRFWSSFAGGLVQFPAAITLVAVTALVFAVIPRATVPVGWALLAAALAIGQFGGLLQLPEWVRDLSPFTHTPVVPGEDPDFVGAIILTLASIAVVALSLVLVRRRQLTT